MNTIEETIQQIDPTFSFKDLEAIDEKIVRSELKKNEGLRSFADLIEASASTFDTMPVDKITKKLVLENQNTLYLYEDNEEDYEEMKKGNGRSHKVPYA